MITINDLKEKYKVDGASNIEVVKKSIDSIVENNPVVRNDPTGAPIINNLLNNLFIRGEISTEEVADLMHYATLKYQETDQKRGLYFS